MNTSTKLHKMKVLENEKISKDTYRLRLDAKDVEFNFESGTFLNIKLNNERFILRRPISIFSSDSKNKTIDIIYKIMGDGTKELTYVRPYDFLDILGPLGTGFPIMDDAKRVLLIGGGVGIPPLYELGKRLKENNIEVISVLGFKDKESIFALDEFKSLGDVLICTEDGSFGFKGNVLEGLENEKIEFDSLYSCGPLPMLKAIDYKYKDSKKGYLSFEERMACGIGACYGCMTKTKEGLKRVCKDGPVFKLGEAVYE